MCVLQIVVGNIHSDVKFNILEYDQAGNGTTAEYSAEYSGTWLIVNNGYLK